MSEGNVDARSLTSVELLDAAVWREIDSAEAQPQAAFLEALSRLVGRWLMVRSDAPGMDVVTVLCKARGYIARQEEPQKAPSVTSTVIARRKVNAKRRKFESQADRATAIGCMTSSAVGHMACGGFCSR